MYDLAVIGAGWAGFNAAIRAKQLGLKVCLIDSGEIGGTCLNYGCIPTKALIQSAKVYLQAKKASTFGINLSNLQAEFIKIQERKEKVVQQLKAGMQLRLKEIDFVHSPAEFASTDAIKTDKGTSKIVDDKTHRPNKENIKSPAAKPSRPSVIFTALAKATITKAAKGI